MLQTITDECFEFLTESGGKPLLKNLPRQRDGFIKVKVRHKRATDSFYESFNTAFEHERTRLWQRSVFAQGEKTFAPSTDPTLEPFYIFPVDGFRYMYNPYTTSTVEYKETFRKLLANVGDAAPELFQTMLKYDYVFDRLGDGISGGSEIIIYGIPYYYALRKSLIDDYRSFLYT
jgi:hypothetical protein